MTVSRREEWRFHLVRPKRGYQSTVFAFPRCLPKPWFACFLKFNLSIKNDPLWKSPTNLVRTGPPALLISTAAIIVPQ